MKHEITAVAASTAAPLLQDPGDGKTRNGGMLLATEIF